MVIVLLVAYAGLLAWATLSKSKLTQDDFFLNQRSSSALSVGLSIIVSSVGASATIGMIGMAFVVGTPAFWWLGSGCFGLVILSLFLAEKVRKTNAYTLPHLIGIILGKEARFLASFIIVIAWLAILAAQFSAISTLLSSLLSFAGFDINVYMALGLGFLFITLHSLGGQRVIMRLDRVQTLIIAICLCILLYWLNSVNPTWISASKIEIVNEQFTVTQLIYYLIIVGANYVVCPMLFSRVLSAKDEKTAKRGGIIAVMGLGIAACLIVCIGLAAKGLIPANTSQDMVLTSIFSDVMPPWLFILASFALLSAIVSSADTCLVVASAVLSYDILQNSKTNVARKCAVLLGICGALLSLWGKGILGFLLMAYDVFACGVVVPVFVALMLSDRRSIQPYFACVAIILGGIIGCYGAITADTSFTYSALALSGGITLYGYYKNKAQNASLVGK